jgi:hypothetical protein
VPATVNNLCHFVVVVVVVVVVVTEAFADHFSSIFNTPSPVVIPNNAHFTFSDFFNRSFDFRR